MHYADFYKRKMEQPDAFWRDQSALIDWHTPFSQVLDYRRPPFAKWFVGGATNLCHNAVERWAARDGGCAANPECLGRVSQCGLHIKY